MCVQKGKYMKNPYNEEAHQDLTITFDRGISLATMQRAIGFMVVTSLSEKPPENERWHWFAPSTSEKAQKEYDLSQYPVGAYHCDDSFAWSGFIYQSQDGTSFEIRD